MMAIEKEGIYFMYELNYGMLCANFSEVLDYCFKNSDSFSMITTLKKPYKTNLPICVHDNIIECWKNCLINLKPDIKKWPGTETRSNHKAMLKNLGELIVIFLTFFLLLSKICLKIFAFIEMVRFGYIR